MSSCLFTGFYRKDPRGPAPSGQAEPMNSGPDGWKFLHLSALDGKLTQALAQNFGACVSCPQCKTHFLQMIKDHPVTSSKPGPAFATTVLWHDTVNRKRGVPAMGLAKAKRLWESMPAHEAAVARAVPQVSALIAAQ